MSLLLGEILDNKICQSKDYKTVYSNTNYTLCLKMCALLKTVQELLEAL